MNQKSTVVSVTVMVFAAAWSCGCAATKQARSVECSGFLGEYRSLLHPGSADEMLLFAYQKPGLDGSIYNKILLEPVSIWHEPGAKLSAKQRNEPQHLADSVFTTLHEKLSKDYEMVQESGPGPVRMQIAITHGEKSLVGLSFVSKVVPQLRVPNMLWSFATGKPFFTGGVSIKFKVTDSETGELLAAGADKRVGGQKVLDTEVFNRWGDVQNAFEFWGDLAVYRMCRTRGGCELRKAARVLTSHRTAWSEKTT